MSLSRRLERLERLAEDLLGGEHCPECGGPVPHEGPPVVRVVYPDGTEELEHPFCELCQQLVDDRGRGLGPRMPGRWNPGERAAEIILDVGGGGEDELADGAVDE